MVFIVEIELPLSSVRNGEITNTRAPHALFCTAVHPRTCVTGKDNRGREDSHDILFIASRNKPPRNEGHLFGRGGMASRCGRRFTTNLPTIRVRWRIPLPE